VDGTCDEVGRRAAWVALDDAGPSSLTLSVRLAGLERPSDVAERLPKALIHRNVPGERVHAFLGALDVRRPAALDRDGGGGAWRRLARARRAVAVAAGGGDRDLGRRPAAMNLTPPAAT
jgi:hypothetical protein